MSGHTYIHTHRTTTVTLAAHARRGLMSLTRKNYLRSKNGYTATSSMKTITLASGILGVLLMNMLKVATMDSDQPKEG